MLIYMKTDWNLGLLFKNEKEIASERKIVEEKTNAFVKKWEGRDDYLKDALKVVDDPNILVNVISIRVKQLRGRWRGLIRKTFARSS